MNEERKYDNNNTITNDGSTTNNINPNSSTTNPLSGVNLSDGGQGNNNINQNQTTITSSNNFSNQSTNETAPSQQLNGQQLNSQPIENLPPANNNANLETTDSRKSKKNNILPLAIIGLIILIAIGGLIAYKTLPIFQNKFKVMINETFKYLESNISINENTTGNMNLKIKSTSDEPELKNLEKLGFSANYAIDYKNKLLNLDIKSSYDNETLINASIFGQSQAMYIKLDDIYDKTIKATLNEEYDTMFEQSVNAKDQKIILQSINKALNNSLKEEYFTKGKDTVNNEKVNTTTLTINKDNYQSIKEDLINTLLNDKNFIKSMAKVSEKKEKEIETTLKESRDEKTKVTKEIKLTIYTKGTKFIKFEIKSVDTTIAITNNKDQYEYTINAAEDTITGTFKSNTNKDETTRSLTMTYQGVTLELNTNTKKGSNLSSKDITNTIEYTEIPEDDVTNMYLKIFQNKTLTKLLEDFGMNDNTDDYDDDWSLNDDDWIFTDENL